MGFAARYRAHRLVYAEPYEDIRDAIRREKKLKGWRRAKKRALVDAANPGWSDLLTLAAAGHTWETRGTP